MFGAEWLRSLGMIPNEYLSYFYFADDTVSALSEKPRGEYLLEQQAGFYGSRPGLAGGRARAVEGHQGGARPHVHGRGARRPRARAGPRRTSPAATRPRRWRWSRRSPPTPAPCGSSTSPTARRCRSWTSARWSRCRAWSAPPAPSRSPSARARARPRARRHDQGGRARHDRGGADRARPRWRSRRSPCTRSSRPSPLRARSSPSTGSVCPSWRSGSHERRPRRRHPCLPRLHVRRPRVPARARARSASRATCCARPAAARSPRSAPPGSGSSTALVAPLGDDLAGRFVRHALEQEGIAVGEPRGNRTPTTVVMPVAGERSMVTVDPGVRARAADLEALSPRAVAATLEQIDLLPGGVCAFVTCGDDDARAFAGRLPRAARRMRALIVNRREAAILTGDVHARGGRRASWPRWPRPRSSRSGPEGAVALVDDRPVAVDGRSNTARWSTRPAPATCSPPPSRGRTCSGPTPRSALALGEPLRRPLDRLAHGHRRRRHPRAAGRGGRAARPAAAPGPGPSRSLTPQFQLCL